MVSVINLKQATAHHSEAQTAYLARVDELVKELEESLTLFAGGHPALIAQHYTLVTHEADFFLPARRTQVEAHVLTPITMGNSMFEIVLYRVVEDDTVSFGLYDGIVAANSLVAKCVILKASRLKDVFIPPGANVDNELAETANVGLENLEVIVGLVKALAA